MLIPLKKDDLEMILPWRNQDEVRQNSFTDHIISKEEHLLWWQKVSQDPARKWFVFYSDNKPAGVVNYYDIKPGKEAFWGFYLADQLADYEKLKLWFLLEKAVIDFACRELKLKKLKCELFAFNKAALFMHKRSGFQEIDTREHEKGRVLILQMTLMDSTDGK